MLIPYILNLTKWSASFFADFMNGGNTDRLIGHSRVNGNPCLKESYFYKHMLDTRVRGYDDGGIIEFKTSGSKILLQTSLNSRLLKLRDSLTRLQWTGGLND